MTTIRKIVTSKVDGNYAESTDLNEIRPFGETAFYLDDNNQLTLMMFDGTRTHVQSKVLTPGKLYGSNKDGGLNGGAFDTIKLVPDAELYNNDNNYALVVDVTGEGAINLRSAGTINSAAVDLYVGGTQNYVKVSDYSDHVQIRSSLVGEGVINRDWTFNNEGYLTLPTGGTLGPEGMGWTGLSNGLTQQPVTVAFKSNTGTWHSAITLVGGDDIDGIGAVYLETFNANTETSHQWTFAGNGTTTAPGDIIVNSALIRAVPTVSPAGTIISVPLNAAGDTVDYTGGASVIEVPTNGDTTQVVAGWIITFNGGAQRTVSGRIEAGGYTSIYFNEANPGGTLYPLTIQSADYVAASTGNISIFPAYSDANVKLTISANGNITVPGNINYANGVNILSGLGGADFSNVSLIQSPGNLTIQTQRTDTATVTNENGTPGGPGSNVITGQAIYNPEIVLIQPGWTVTGNNLANLTTVTNVSVDGFGAYTITTDTTEVEPFWYNDIYTFTSNATVYSNLVVDTGNIISGYSGINFVANSSGDGNGYSTIELRPDASLNTDQYIIVDPTGGEPGHIHLRAGGTQDASGADLFLGGELTFVRVSDTSGHVTIRTTNVGDPNITLDWRFEDDGNLYFPGIGNNRIGESEPGLVASSDNSVVLQSNNGGVSNEWYFGSNGRLQLPSLGEDSSEIYTTEGGISIKSPNYTELRYSSTDPANVSPTSNVDGFIWITDDGAHIQNYHGGEFNREWIFGTNGNLSLPGSITFPDTTVQTTAWTGIAGDNIAIGNGAAASGQGINSVAIGSGAGNDTQGNLAVAVGKDAGLSVQGDGAVAVGDQAGWVSQSFGAVAIGQEAGRDNQGIYSIAIGNGTGADTQGSYAVAIGYGAGTSNQPANSIIINAGINSLNASTTGLFVNPVRQDNSNVANVVYYNTSTKEVTYGPAISGGGTIYGNANVATFLGSFGSNTVVTTGNISAGNVRANTSLRFDSGNVTITNESGYVSLNPDTGYSATAGVKIGGSGYLLGPNGARNLTLNYGGTSGAVGLQGNVTVGTAGTGVLTVTGVTSTGISTVVAGVTNTLLPNTVASFSSNVNSYTQLTLQNKNTGADATTDVVLTSDAGSDVTNYVDLGIINSGYDNNTPTNSLGNVVFANDSYLYAQGNTAATAGGNLVIGTTTSGKAVKIFAGGNTASAVVMTVANTGVTVAGNITGSSANVQLVAGTYTSTFDNQGNVSLPGNVTVNGMGVTMPTRPAFRIYGAGSTNWTTANTNFKGSSIVVDYNQGSYFNSSTGVFTAPIAGLYNVTLTARIGNNNGQNQIMVLKNNLNTAGNVAVMWECDTNTGTAVHYGVSSVMKLAAGDFLTANITAGAVQFDANDSWTVTYLG